jgi:hypothetical protein
MGWRSSLSCPKQGWPLRGFVDFGFGVAEWEEPCDAECLSQKDTEKASKKQP